ncbi:MAG: L-alanine-DL-glutamate epimerase-like enolase superfamily enzyme [Rhodothermales bacterium]|jgi:L-alanine-DL-glutamate epimerase-like enolase superfamily enzyme
MQISVSPLHLRLQAPFRIAHGVTVERTNVLVEVNGGRGEAGLPPYLPTDYATAHAWLSSITLPEWSSDEPPPIVSWLGRLPAGPLPARCALDMALHDSWAKRIGQPLHVLMGVDPARSPVSFMTVSIPERLEDLTLDSLPDHPRLKLKLGSGDAQRDIAIVQRVRSLTDAELCVDANGAWSIPEAVSIIPRLNELNLLFVEQPIADTDPEDWHLLRRLLPKSSSPPLIADESFSRSDDAIALAGAADGVNIKLAKCGGIAASRALVHLARTLDFQVVLGCMVESSLAITAAATLAPLADFADLDGAQLLANDPFRGVTFAGGRPVMPMGAGLGVEQA